ncbi:hypothetical protein Nepgr_031709 [Nepenthes gracilis]|uniref:Uncharacterized protein n=1 Tax=Nepenthes gracilis TaxID=150966 RepID=A0AAD3Y7R3_NEPGR|nr:hypothetical protein Nepgr_031709 [Nepenthes gracilis]
MLFVGSPTSRKVEDCGLIPDGLSTPFEARAVASWNLGSLTIIVSGGTIFGFLTDKIFENQLAKKRRSLVECVHHS